MVKSKYRYCKVCGRTFDGSERERHVRLEHEAKIDVRYPKQWFLDKKPTEEEQEKYRKQLLTTAKEKGKYLCAVCKRPLNARTIHDHYVKELANKFHEEGFKVIIEGKIPMKWFPYRGQWREPDLFVLKDSKLAKVVEVIVADPYENGKAGVTVYNKCKTIRDYYNPPEIIVFEPVNYLDKEHLPETKKHYKQVLGKDLTSYKQIHRFYAEKWKEEGLNVVFWDEKSLKHALYTTEEN